jgi:hypothetical protein
MRAADPTLLKTFIQERGLSYKTTTSSYVFDCPRCLKSDKLWMYRDGTQFKCWVCAESDGFGGRPEKALAEIAGIPIDEVRSLIYTDLAPKGTSEVLFGFRTEEEEDSEEEGPLPDLVWPLHIVPLDQKSAVRGRKYLEQNRGIPLGIAMEYGIRYNLDTTAVVFPVYVGELLVGWQERATGVVPRFLEKLSTPGMPRSRVVMFQNRLVSAESAVIGEGPIDALKAHFIGGNVATMGKTINKGQIEVIKNSGVKSVYIALDPDAHTEITKLIDTFHDYETYLVNTRIYKDLGAMPLDEATASIMESPRVHPGYFVNPFH